MSAPATGARDAFVFDPSRCTGCDACRLACAVENELPWGESWRRVHTYNPEGHPAAPRFHLTLACQHCERAPCLDACPALAIGRDPASGAVLIDAARCIGCRYCAWACPYEAPRFDATAGVMTKCTLCVHRLREGQAPACTGLCPTGALSFARLAPDALVHDLEGFVADGLRPALRIEPGRAPLAPPAGLAADPAPPAPAPSAGAGLRAEWPLLAFSGLVALLVAVTWARLLGGPPTSPSAFAAVGALAFGLGALHLGRPGRAWRALLNVRRSWLSREIALLGLFVPSGLAWLAAPRPGAAAGAAVALLGLALLVAVDLVYARAEAAPHARPHPASALLMAPFMAAVLAGAGWLALAVGALQALLLARRVRGERARGVRGRPALDALRVVLGFVVPWLAWAPGEPALRAVAIGAALLGQALDRAGFYLDLRFPSPRRALDEALERRLRAVS